MPLWGRDSAKLVPYLVFVHSEGLSVRKAGLMDLQGYEGRVRAAGG